MAELQKTFGDAEPTVDQGRRAALKALFIGAPALATVGAGDARAETAATGEQVAAATDEQEYLGRIAQARLRGRAGNDAVENGVVGVAVLVGEDLRREGNAEQGARNALGVAFADHPKVVVSPHIGHVDAEETTYVLVTPGGERSQALTEATLPTFVDKAAASYYAIHGIEPPVSTVAGLDRTIDG